MDRCKYLKTYQNSRLQYWVLYVWFITDTEQFYKNIVISPMSMDNGGGNLPPPLWKIKVEKRSTHQISIPNCDQLTVLRANTCQFLNPKFKKWKVFARKMVSWSQLSEECNRMLQYNIINTKNYFLKIFFYPEFSRAIIKNCLKAVSKTMLHGPLAFCGSPPDGPWYYIVHRVLNNMQ
jgi:hypothetical protein